MTTKESKPEEGQAGPLPSSGLIYTQLALEIDLGPLNLEVVQTEPSEAPGPSEEIPGQLQLFETKESLKHTA